MALPKEHRLAKKDSEYVLKNGKTVKNSFFFIRFLRNKTNYCRIAILISLRISKSSAVRNRIRRKVAEVFKTINPWNHPLDIVFVATPSIVGKPSREIKRELINATNIIFVNPVNNSFNEKNHSETN